MEAYTFTMIRNRMTNLIHFKVCLMWNNTVSISSKKKLNFFELINTMNTMEIHDELKQDLEALAVTLQPKYALKLRPTWNKFCTLMKQLHIAAAKIPDSKESEDDEVGSIGYFNRKLKYKCANEIKLAWELAGKLTSVIEQLCSATDALSFHIVKQSGIYALQCRSGIDFRTDIAGNNVIDFVAQIHEGETIDTLHLVRAVVMFSVK